MPSLGKGLANPQPGVGGGTGGPAPGRRQSSRCPLPERFELGAPELESSPGAARLDVGVGVGVVLGLATGELVAGAGATIAGAAVFDGAGGAATAAVGAGGAEEVLEADVVRAEVGGSGRLDRCWTGRAPGVGAGGCGASCVTAESGSEVSPMRCPVSWLADQATTAVATIPNRAAAVHNRVCRFTPMARYRPAS